MWIESHQSLERHPKMLLLKSEMSWSKNETIGFLHRFWWAVLEFSLDGGTSKLSPTLMSEMFDMDIATITKALDSMKKVGLINKNGFVHDWWDYAGRFIQSKYSHEPERWKAIRKRTLSVRLAYASHPPPTIPNLPTIPNQTIPKEHKSDSQNTQDSPKTEKPYKIETPLEKVVCFYKYLLGVGYENRVWDKSNWGRAAAAAKLLLESFDGDHVKTQEYMSEQVKYFKSQKTPISWTIETLAKKAEEWKARKKESVEA